MGPLAASASLPPHSLAATLSATAHGGPAQTEGGGGGGGGGAATGFQQEVRQKCHEHEGRVCVYVFRNLSLMNTHTHTHTHTQDLNLVSPYIEVAFGEATQRTTTACGPNPFWNEELSLPFQ